MKISQHRFYRGASIWSDQSGLLAVCEESLAQGGDSMAPAQRLLDTLGQLHHDLRDVVPVMRESETLADSARWMRQSPPTLHWVLAMAEVVARDFCWRPAIGWVQASDEGTWRLFIPAEDEGVALPALGFALFLRQVAQKDLRGDWGPWAQEVAQQYKNTRLAMRRSGLNQSTLALARCAFQRGIPVSRILVPGQLTQLGQGVNAKRITETATSLTSTLAAALSGDKLTTAVLLSRAGIPTPGTQAAHTLAEAHAIAGALGFPLVVKPRRSGKGKGVTVDIRTTPAFEEAVAVAASFQKGLIVERFVAGDDHRLLIVGGRFVAAARRIPAHVMGDGVSTVTQLVAKENLDPQRGLGFERLREKIELDAEADQHLAAVGLSALSIPGLNQHVRLRDTANISRGGSSVDVTDEVHPDNRAIAERAARLTGIDVCGVDFLTPDISRSWREVKCAILEVNTSPGLRPHLGANLQRDVVAPIIDHLFPGGGDGRVPTVGITGSLGKTTTAQMVAAILTETGRCVALSTTQGAWIGNQCVQVGDVAGGGMARELLKDSAVEAGVFELSRGGLLKRGITLDSLDVGVVLKISDNHIGVDGLRSREDLARVKSIVARSARRWLVLNADDPLCLQMRPTKAGPQVCLVSEYPDGAVITDHIAAGGTCVTLHGRGAQGYLRLRSGAVVIGDLELAALPTTRGGQFTPAIWNSMSAMAAAHGLGVAFPTIRKALCGFSSDYATNPGRMNQVRGLPFELLLTFADGPVAFSELARIVRAQSSTTPKTLIFSTVGNRQDPFIVDSAKAVAGAFDRYVCCDMEEDLRGRPPGEVARLLAAGLRQAGVAEAAIEVASSGSRALDTALRQASDHSLLVVVDFYPHKVMSAIRSIWPNAH